jgi:sensor histidine kinase YesM
MYSLKAILATFTKSNASKRTLFNQAPLGGISSSVVTLFFFCLPFIEFAAIFNPVVFSWLGIAQSIVFFIVFLSIVMIIVFVVTWAINKRVLKKILPSWERFFPNVDIKMVLSSGITPYSDFYKYYAQCHTLEEDALHKALLKAFAQMEDENKDLIEAMQKDRSRA